MKITLVAVLLLALPATSLAVTRIETGNGLFEAMHDGEPGHLYALGYAVGVMDALASSAGGKQTCYPEDATSRQILDAAKKFLQEHPELRHHTAASLLQVAFTKAFPCRY
jgi:hypothetical protein